MLCASPGSFSNRYRSALASASGMASAEMVFNTNISILLSQARPAGPLWQDAQKQFPQWIVEFIHHAFLQRDDGVLRNRDIFRAHLAAAGGDVAVAYVVRVLEIGHPVPGV